MALISCNECKSEISDKAASCPKCGSPNEIYKSDAVSPALNTEIKKSGGLLKWIIGIPIGLFALMMIFGSTVGNTPEAKDRARERSAIDVCWDMQSKKSLDPSAARFAAGACEKMESDFRQKHKTNP